MRRRPRRPRRKQTGRKLASDARLAAAQSEADRLKRDSDRAESSDAAQTEADRLKRENDAQRAAAQADLDRAAAEKAQAEADKAQLRAQLLLQFNAILQTRDTARGLIVNMSDVLFDTAKFSLRPAAREKLARVAGILRRASRAANAGGRLYRQRRRRTITISSSRKIALLRCAIT